jgi:hypothetical protein
MPHRGVSCHFCVLCRTVIFQKPTPERPGDPQVQLAYTMYADHHWTVDELCATLRISRDTCYRYVALARRAVPKE